MSERPCQDTSTFLDVYLLMEQVPTLQGWLTGTLPKGFHINRH